MTARKLIITLAIVLGMGGVAWADAIDPGFDLFHTPAFTFPFDAPLGPVELVGLPIEGGLSPLGNTDTIIERLTGLPADATGLIDIQMFALSLVSTSPVNVMGSFFDVFVDLNPSIPSTGVINVLTHGVGGGTFSSELTVFALVHLLDPVTGVEDSVIPATTVLSNSSADWSHTAPPRYPVDPRFPAGNFYSGPINHPIGPHPVVPASTIPEPSTLVLLGAGLVAAAASRWRRRTQR
jgi:hypothetical protein